ncbi:hypothetical protein N2152v2_007784 [Parachlorella kessleri]
MKKDILGVHNTNKSHIKHLNAELELEYGCINSLLASLEPPTTNEVDLDYVQMALLSISGAFVGVRDTCTDKKQLVSYESVVKSHPRVLKMLGDLIGRGIATGESDANPATSHMCLAVVALRYMALIHPQVAMYLAGIDLLGLSFMVDISFMGDTVEMKALFTACRQQRLKGELQWLMSFLTSVEPPGHEFGSFRTSSPAGGGIPDIVTEILVVEPTYQPQPQQQ